MKTIPSPLAAGFRAGIRGEKIDTATFMSPMKLADLIKSTAAKFRVHQRTVRRWHQAGVDLQNWLAVAEHIALKSNSPAALQAALETFKISS